jgi:hypothetical protein
MGPYLVHKVQLVHKCTKPTWDVHREINDRRKYCKEALPRRTKLDVDFCENPSALLLPGHTNRLFPRTDHEQGIPTNRAPPTLDAATRVTPFALAADCTAAARLCPRPTSPTSADAATTSRTYSSAPTAT